MKDEKNEIIELNYQDVLFVASGVDKAGNPKSGGTIAIDQIVSEDDTQTLANAPMDCEFQIYSEGGAVVLQCDFSGAQIHEQAKVLTICQDYLSRKNENPNNNEILSVLVVPIPLQGSISILFQGLTYFTGIDFGTVKRLILVFDNTLTQLFKTDDVDMKEIQGSIELELKRELESLDNQIFEAQEELRKLQNQNKYEAMVKERFSGIGEKHEDPESQDDAEQETAKERGESSWID